MNDKINIHNLEQIYNRLDEFSDLLKQSIIESADIEKLRTIVEDLRANLFQTIDGRVDYIMDKQKAECKVRIDTIEENIRKINENIEKINESSQKMKKDIIDNIELIKKDISNSIESLNNKINKHIENRVDWVQIISTVMPKVLITFLGVVIIISVAILDRYFDFGILKFLYILK